jgi:adenosylcobinamide amidohydrolase
MSWELLLERPGFRLRRRGRCLVAELIGAHRVLSTAVTNGGQTEHVRFLLNHQSCEGAGHHEVHKVITEIGYPAYHARVCAEASVPPGETAMMGTAANMHYAAWITEADEGVEVTAVVTAGVEGNATCAGDPANWRETDAGMEKVPAYAGTINTILLVNRPLTAAALARAVMTMTEGKSAALQRLAVPSRQSADFATGTGTDQFCIAAPLGEDGVRTSASPHVKLGELIGLAVRRATQEALRWQNGLEPSYTRGVFHALGRYGIREATFFDDIAPLLDADSLELLRKNTKSVMYEPLVGAAAHALAAVLDRVRHGAVPASVEWDASVQQAAVLAANLANKPANWPTYRELLWHQSPHPQVGGQTPLKEGLKAKSLILAALALGWTEKWRSSSA